MNALSDLQLRVNHTLKEREAKEQLKVEAAKAKEVMVAEEVAKLSDIPPPSVKPPEVSPRIIQLIKKVVTKISSLFNQFIKK